MKSRIALFVAVSFVSAAGVAQSASPWEKIAAKIRALEEIDVRAILPDGSRMQHPYEGGIAGAPFQNWVFEPAPDPMPFTVGNLDLQNGWTTFTGGGPAPGPNSAGPQVSTAAPALSGAQWIDMPVGGAVQGTFNGPFGPVTVQPIAGGQYTMSTRIRISNTGGADYDVISQSPTQGFITSYVKFFFDDFDPDGAGPLMGDGTPGDILIVDDLDGPGPGGLTFQDSGRDYSTAVPPNVPAAQTLTVVLDPPAIRYYIDALLAYTGNVIAGTSMEQFILPNDNFHLAGEKGQIDDVSIEPGIPPNLIVDCITYNSPHQRILDVTVKIVDDSNTPVSGAQVKIKLTGTNGVDIEPTGTTNAAGEVLFSRRFTAACYTTNVLTVTKAGYVYDGTEPANGYLKNTDPAPDADCRAANDPCGTP